MAYKDKGESGSRDFGMVVKSPSYPGALVKPVFNRDVREYTLFRPTGPVNKEGTDFLPWRNSPAPGDFGIGGFNDWFFKEDVFDGGTAHRVTFIAATKDENGQIISNDIRPSVAHDFVTLVRRGVKDTVDEIKLMKGSSRGGAPVKTPRTHGFVQGMLMARGQKDYRSAPRFPCILMLTQSAREALYDALEAQVPNYTGDPQDMEARFLSGNVLTAAGGKLLAFSSNRPEATKRAEVGPTTFVPGGGVQQSSGQRGDTEFLRYICEIHPQGFDDLPRDANGKLAIAREMLFTPWDQALMFLTEQEMIEQLIRAYLDVPHILRIGLGHIPGALPDSITRGARTFPGLGAGMPGAAQQPQGAAPQSQGDATQPGQPAASPVAPAFGAGRGPRPSFAPTVGDDGDELDDDGDEDPALSPANGPATGFNAPAGAPVSKDVQDALAALRRTVHKNK